MMAVKSPEFRLLIEKISFCRAYVYSGGEFVVRLCGTYDGCQESRRCLLRDWAEGCGIMLMVRSDLAASGVMFSIDTETGYRDAVFITGAYGLGENVVQGTVDPDEILVHKPTYELGFDKVPLRRVIGRKQVKMVYTHGRGAREPVKNIPTPHEDRERLCITDAQAMELAGAAIKIEKHYSAVHGKLTPMDMEWALDGLDGKIYLVQARPETVASQQAKNILERYTIRGKGKILTTGRAVGTKIVTGRARIIRDASELSEFQEGEILVSDTTTPDWEPVMKRSAAIITNRGGRTCHASIISRELGIAATVGCTTATKDIKTGQMITVSCGEGDTGKVYEGEIPFDLDRIDLGKVQKPKTDMMVNIGNPEKAFETSLLPAAGVGLARMEFILNKMKVHPMALVHPERLTDEEEREEIAQLIHNFKDGPDYFVRTLAEGVGTICAAFYPRPVVIRMSDFKSNEYSQLLGGAVFEPKEENPMIGFRGASRYVHPAYQEGFELECRAIKFVRETMGLTNLTPMIPFCRTITEAKKVLEVMEKCGLKRGVDGLKMYVMCEIPNNVISIDEFSKLFDGFSIGSNDLTQLTLGCDRDSDLVANDFDERDPGVLKMLELAVQGCKRNGRHSGICGQAPSDYPEIAEYLVKLGIDSISLIPDTLIKTMVAINDLETKMSK
uniref:Pyruvate, water dikinase n=1 Tax=Mucochytrium quahogii TaxID=96639 RepID=A0A7S2SLM2_9STRA|mmetsp:Transcript_7806/g.17050  ORF Transcript_7806/g.17050 Transcript_7806/m.17050 type:complete len:671 (+) Transcript_7806:297-2309(+)